MRSQAGGFASQSSTNTRRIARTLSDQNVVILKRFEDSSSTAGDHVDNPDRRASYPEDLQSSSDIAAPILESPSLLDNVVYLHNRFRNRIARLLVQPGVDPPPIAACCDEFVVHVQRFGPVGGQ